MTNARRYFLAIRHRPSGALLPNIRGYGFTRTEPSFTDPPRLFTAEGPAKQALSWWLQGEHYEQEGHDSDFGDSYVRVRPRRDRCAADMEIVEVEVVIRTLSQAQLRNL